MAERNPFNEIVDQMAYRILDARRAAREADPVPFGEERVDARELERRAPSSREARQALLDSKGGRERILKLIRQRRGAGNG